MLPRDLWKEIVSQVEDLRPWYTVCRMMNIIVRDYFSNHHTVTVYEDDDYSQFLFMKNWRFIYPCLPSEKFFEEIVEIKKIEFNYEPELFEQLKKYHPNISSFRANVHTSHMDFSIFKHLQNLEIVCLDEPNLPLNITFPPHLLRLNSIGVTLEYKELPKSLRHLKIQNSDQSLDSIPFKQLERLDIKNCKHLSLDILKKFDGVPHLSFCDCNFRSCFLENIPRKSVV